MPLISWCKLWCRGHAKRKVFFLLLLLLLPTKKLRCSCRMLISDHLNYSHESVSDITGFYSQESFLPRLVRNLYELNVHPWEPPLPPFSPFVASHVTPNTFEIPSPLNVFFVCSSSKPFACFKYKLHFLSCYIGVPLASPCHAWATLFVIWLDINPLTWLPSGPFVAST